MIITKLKVARFGKLKNFHIDFHSGFNIVCGDNEAGKSTLQAFIKAMLFGMNSKVQKVRENDRKRYQPWNGDKAHGELHFQGDDHVTYIIKKRFGSSKGQDETIVIDGVTGKEALQFKGQIPGEVLFGVGEDAFEKMTYIRQLGCAVASASKDEIMQRIENLRQSGDEDTSYQKAYGALMEVEKTLTARKGKITSLDTDIRNFVTEYHDLNRLHEENIQDEIAVKSLAKEEVDLQVKIKALDFRKLQMKSFLLKKQYEDIKFCADKVNSLSKEKAILRNEITCEGVVLDESFLEDTKNKLTIWKQFTNQWNELQETQVTTHIQKEAFDLEEEINLVRGNLETLACFENVNDNVEKTIFAHEEMLNKLRQAFAAGDKSEILEVRKDSLLDKSKLVLVVAVLGIIITAAGIIGGVTLSRWVMAVSILGIGITVFGFLKRSKLSEEIIELENKIHAQVANEAIQQEIRTLESSLCDTYSTYGINNFAEFMAGVRKYGEQQHNLETLKARLLDRQKALVLQEENLQKVTKERQEIQDKLKAKVAPFMSEVLSMEAVENLLVSSMEKLKKLRDLEGEIASSNAAYKALTKDKDILEIEEELNALSHVALDQDKLMTSEAIDSLLKESQDRLLQLTKELTVTNQKIANRFLEKKPIVQVEQEMESARHDLDHFTAMVEAAQTAGEVLQESFKEIQQDFGPLLNKNAGDVLRAITLGKYQDLKIAEDYSLLIADEKENTSKDIAYFSNGTWDQIYFALRMGIVNLLFEGNSPIPVILDDTFVQFDDKRLVAVMKYLSDYAKEHQVILFSCQKRERDVMQGNFGNVECYINNI